MRLLTTRCLFGIASLTLPYAAFGAEPRSERPAGAVPFRENGLWGYRTLAKEVLTPPRFDAATRFVAGLSLAKRGNELVLVDRAGAVRELGGGDRGQVLDATHVAVGSPAGFEIVSLGDASQRVALPDIAELGRPLSAEGLAARSRETGKWGVLGFSGRRLVPLKYAFAGSPRFGLAPVFADVGGFGYVGMDGREALPRTFRFTDEFSADGLALADDGKGIGYIDRTLKFPAGPRFFQALPFCFGVAWVRTSRDEPFRLIDRDYKTLIPAKYHRAGPFVKDWAAVAGSPDRPSAAKLDTLITKADEIVYEAVLPRHDIEPVNGGYAWVSEYRGVSIVTRAGERIDWMERDAPIPPERLLPEVKRR